MRRVNPLGGAGPPWRAWRRWGEGCMVSGAVATDPLRSDADALGRRPCHPGTERQCQSPSPGPMSSRPRDTSGSLQSSTAQNGLATRGRRRAASCARGRGPARREHRRRGCARRRRSARAPHRGAERRACSEPDRGSAPGWRRRHRAARQGPPRTGRNADELSTRRRRRVDPAAGRISVESPVGQALVGRRVGDRVEVETPGGDRTIEILDVGAHA